MSIFEGSDWFRVFVIGGSLGVVMLFLLGLLLWICYEGKK